ncbi:DUF1640-domain-containing protein [Testicularia cyperi]|uniref:DUF1640-domain-containing protein n=1 Tax=Testicularia cyperi TaxID=1882483 RepID=A0A317XGN1_9BASI|nr:DUF1640-domain-containing protein [Testicularia cyperi]
MLAAAAPVTTARRASRLATRSVVPLPLLARGFINDTNYYAPFAKAPSSWTSPVPSTPLSSKSTFSSASANKQRPVAALPARTLPNFSPSSTALTPSSAATTKTFSTTRYVQAHNFDTQAFAQRLEASGISREQADVLTEALRDVIDESISNLAKGLVTREEGEKTTYTQKVDFTRLKSELQLLERNDFAVMKSENERLMADVEKLKQRLREEITRTTAGVRLDLNLEKGRIRDESSVHALKIKEVDTRIESEIAGLRTSIQSAKFNVLQYLVGVATGAGALLLAYLRMFR